MAATCEERPAGREFGTDRGTIKYLITGAADYAEALAALLATAPLVSGDLSRESAEAVETEVDGAWEGTAGYRLLSSKAKEVGESTYQFDTGGGTQHITQSKATAGDYASGTPPSFGGAIGVSHDSVEGCDVTVPVYTFSETHYFADASVTALYKAALYALTGKTNAAEFKGFAINEVLFLGASGSQRGDGVWEITFRFAASPNVEALTIGTITGIEKFGWDYLWVRYEDAEDAGAACLVKRPASVHVEMVYDQGDFTALGIDAEE